MRVYASVRAGKDKASDDDKHREDEDNETQDFRGRTIGDHGDGEAVSSASMRRTSWVPVLALPAALVTPACQPSPAISVVHVVPGDPADSLRGDAVKIRHSAQDAYVGARPGYYIVRSTEDWASAWPKGEAPALPEPLDPARSMLVFVVAENRDSVGLAITKIMESGDRIHVAVKETRAGAGCRTNAERVPFDAVVAPRSDKPVKFHVEDARGEACGDMPGVTLNCRVAGALAWEPAIRARPGDSVECYMTSETRSNVPITDTQLFLFEVPAGSNAKFAYTSGTSRAAFKVDVFGTYTARAEATDEIHRTSVATAQASVMPAQTRDVTVQLVWKNVAIGDDPTALPRVKLRAVEETASAKKRPGLGTQTANECAVDHPRPEFCDVKAVGANLQMTVKSSDKHILLDVLYVDERADKGPVVCVQVYAGSARTSETCDATHRDANESWSLGRLDARTGKLLGPEADASNAADAGASPALTAPLPRVIPPVKPAPPIPPLEQRGVRP